MLGHFCNIFTSNLVTPFVRLIYYLILWLEGRDVKIVSCCILAAYFRMTVNYFNVKFSQFWQGGRAR